MNKIMSAAMSVASIGCLAVTAYIACKYKKNMLDVLIEEIETIK